MVVLQEKEEEVAIKALSSADSALGLPAFQSEIFPKIILGQARVQRQKNSSGLFIASHKVSLVFCAGGAKAMKLAVHKCEGFDCRGGKTTQQFLNCNVTDSSSSCKC